MKRSEQEDGQKWYEAASGKRRHSKKNTEKYAAAQEKRLQKKQEKAAEPSEKGRRAGTSTRGAVEASTRGAGGNSTRGALRENTRRVVADSTSRAPGTASRNTKRPASSPLFLHQIPQESADILNHFDSIIASVHSLSSKQQVQLANDIRILSHKLTDERTSRRLGYMNESSSVSAYLSYFLWWNLVRLVPLFSALSDDSFSLTDGSAALDIGSGPLTVPIALWLAKPELRKKKITWYTVDLSQTALQAGEELFLAIAAQTAAKTSEQNGGGQAEPWKIVRVRGELGTAIRQKAQLVTAANVFNEIVQNQDMPPDYLAKKYTKELLSYAADGTPSQTVLLIEPGDPKSARFVSLMRDALMRRDFFPLAPCPHTGTCPMEGKKGGKWCNFAFTTENAPQALLKLSEKAGLPKDRAVLSFVLSKRSTQEKNASLAGLQNDAPAEPQPDASRKKSPKTAPRTEKKLLPLRITSDFIKLPDLHRSAYYACSELGLVLAVDEHHVQPENGELLFIPRPDSSAPCERDKKSGALLLRL